MRIRNSSDDEIVLAALDGIADEKLAGLALRLLLSDHIGISHKSQPDLLTEAEQVFAPKKPKVVKAKADGSKKPKPTAAETPVKKRSLEIKQPRLFHTGPGFVWVRLVSR
jgi:ParB family chromosome partitioning protein